jgi:hypothetical protein
MNIILFHKFYKLNMLKKTNACYLGLGQWLIVDGMVDGLMRRKRPIWMMVLKIKLASSEHCFFPSNK